MPFKGLRTKKNLQYREEFREFLGRQSRHPRMLTPSLENVSIATLYVGFDSFLLQLYMCGGDST